MNIATIETFQKLDIKSRLLADLKNQLSHIRFSSSLDKEKLEQSIFRIQQAEELIQTMYDDIAAGLEAWNWLSQGVCCNENEMEDL